MTPHHCYSSATVKLTNPFLTPPPPPSPLFPWWHVVSPDLTCHQLTGETIHQAVESVWCLHVGYVQTCAVKAPGPVGLGCWIRNILVLVNI